MHRLTGENANNQNGTGHTRDDVVPRAAGDLALAERRARGIKASTLLLSALSVLRCSVSHEVVPFRRRPDGGAQSEPTAGNVGDPH